MVTTAPGCVTVPFGLALAIPPVSGVTFLEKMTFQQAKIFQTTFGSERPLIAGGKCFTDFRDFSGT
jgi:hypothetical protein